MSRAKSLRGALTRSMIIMQALVLLVFTLISAVPLLQLLSAGQVLDERITKDIASAISRGPGGALQLEPSPKLEQVAEEFSGFWFDVTDIEGRQVQMGNLPEQVEAMRPEIPRITSANIFDVDSPDAPAVIIRQQESAAGLIWVVTGGGPRLPQPTLVSALLNPFFLGLVVLFALVSILVIPLIVRRQLRGLHAVAVEANTIDAGQRGVRLTPASVPLELHPLVNAVNEGLRRLDEGIAKQQRFMADAAHELRTPIAILQTRIELLPESEEQRRLLLDVSRLGSMANQLLDLQRMDLSPQALQSIDLVQLASDVASDLAPLAIAAGDELSFETDARKVMVLGDAGSLSRALTNLIQNAIAHGGKGVKIEVSVGHDGRLSVSDTGPGIPPEQREDIFEPFHRVMPQEHGAGLGLNLVRDIVRRHSGRISVNQAPGGGAIFEIFLPLAPAQTTAGH